ncbi:molybdenum-dependent transcriptional regulator [Caulobacter flavus]|uniref:Molybdenum-dependent transcriptional regulator n=1 Tax=Caulobacter flavus TaxID=1679497 RepID=A0A2N5CUM6_9CAUL|nr:TOBE domain-containing protein [Caulobacter flavus]AYV47767.1 molybdenum-dependent transcriptional regulator [Caulobacter flavus]PLR16974.1 molybdenum-dependent transcriptional regulator [Caulobacter flavus]
MSEAGDLSASLILRRGALARVGLERVALIEAVAELGSISAAAKRLELSYKGAWDAVQALNNLFDAPLIAAGAGGRSGGGAQVTPRGHAVVRAFRDMEREVGAALARLEAGLASEVGEDLFWSLGLRTSARNALRGTIVALTPRGVTVEVRLAIGADVEIASVITRRSADELGLAVGRPAVALIKSSFVRLAPEAANSPDGNLLTGKVLDREDGEAASEIVVAIAEGKTLVATVPSAIAGGLAPGAAVLAMIAPSDVILAVD